MTALLTPAATALEDLIGDPLEPPVDPSTAEQRPGGDNQVAFYMPFDSADSNGDGIADYAKPAGDWDYVTRGTDYEFAYGGGYQDLIIKERYHPLSGTTVDRPGGARLEKQRCRDRPSPCGAGGDVGIFRVVKTEQGDLWKAEAWVSIPVLEEKELESTDFRARITIHYYDASGNQEGECFPNGWGYEPDPLGGLVRIETTCEVPVNPDPIKMIRIRVGANSKPYSDMQTMDGEGVDEYAAGSGRVKVDRFKATLVKRSPLG